MTDDEKWDAVVRCDETYDGVFYTGVKTTGIFCRPSCKSKTPLRKNVVFFDTIEEAGAYGLRPCKRCRPDLAEYQPVKELLDKAKDIYDTYWSDGNKLSSEIKQLNVSRNHLTRLFRQQFGLTPTGYLNRLRIARAADLLSQGTMTSLDIAVSCGFESLPSFYACFKRHYGLTPSEYRRGRSGP